MKRLLPLMFAAALPAAAFDVPKAFYTMDQLADARAEAVEKPEMVGFLITNPKLEPS